MARSARPSPGGQVRRGKVTTIANVMRPPSNVARIQHRVVLLISGVGNANRKHLSRVRKIHGYSMFRRRRPTAVSVTATLFCRGVSQCPVTAVP